MEVPEDVQLVGEWVAIRWPGGVEDFLTAGFLRAHSPSAEVAGERDIFGQVSGGGAGAGSPAVSVLGWEVVGRYALRFEFSDGHRTGLYTFPYLRELGLKLRASGANGAA